MRDTVSEKRGSKGLKFFSWKRKSKQPHEEKADVNKEAAAHEAAADEQPTEEVQVAQGAVAAPDPKEAPAAAPEVREPAVTAAPEPAVAAAPEPAVVAAPEPAVVAAHEPVAVAPEPAVAVAPEPAVVAVPEPKDKAKPEEAAVSAPSEAVRQDSGMPSTSDMTNLEGAAPISPPVNLTYEPAQDDDRPGMLRSQTGPRDAAATGGVSTLHKNQAITSPRADSKLKTWFRDRLIRRTSEPQPLYPHQPGPEYSDSESAFTGGAALTGRIEPRGAALSSHPVSTEDLESEHGEYGGVTEESTNNQQVAQNGNSNETSKRHRLRRSWLKTVSRNSQELKTNGTEHPNQSSEAVPTSELRGLRDSAVEQGLPAPPVLGDSLSIRRESRFSEDL